MTKQEQIEHFEKMAAQLEDRANRMMDEAIHYREQARLAKQELSK